MNHIVINADLGKQTISRHIYGHFAEHLGRCIYGGIWVGEDSPIPNVRGIRSDIVAALRRHGVPHVYRLYEGEGHGFRRADSLEDFYRTIETFLLDYVVYA